MNGANKFYFLFDTCRQHIGHFTLYVYLLTRPEALQGQSKFESLSVFLGVQE